MPAKVLKVIAASRSQDWRVRLHAVSFTPKACISFRSEFQFRLSKLEKTLWQSPKRGLEIKGFRPHKATVLQISGATRQLLSGPPCKRRLANDEGTCRQHPAEKKENIRNPYWTIFFCRCRIEEKQKQTFMKGWTENVTGYAFHAFLRQASDIFLSTVSSAPVACSADSSLAILFFDVSDSCVQLANPCRARPLLSAQRITKNLGI